MAIGAFPMAPAFGAKLTVVAVAQKRVVVRVRFDVDVAAVPAIAARWAAARNELLPAEGHAAVSAVASLHQDFGFVNKHVLLVSRGRSNDGCSATPVEKNRNGQRPRGTSWM